MMPQADVLQPCPASGEQSGWIAPYLLELTVLFIHLSDMFAFLAAV